MQASVQMWIQIVAYVFITTTQSAFQGCPSEVVKDTSDVSLNCVGYSGPVSWEFEKPGQTAVSFGTCDTACTIKSGFETLFLLTALSSSSSRLNLSAVATGTNFGDAVYICDTHRCSITIVEPTTTPPPTTTTATPTTPASTRDCAFGVLFNCNDTGGRWGFILFIVIISILCLAILVIGICYVFFRKQTEKVLGPIYRCIDRCLCKKSPDLNKPGPKPDEGAGLAMSDDKPTIPNSTKRGKQTAEKSDMNELRDIPSSPDQDERSHPAKRSRDLPQPGAGGEGQGNVTHSSTHRSLLPVQAVTPLPSVERNSYAESRKLPLPSIDSKDAH